MFLNIFKDALQGVQDVKKMNEKRKKAKEIEKYTYNSKAFVRAFNTQYQNGGLSGVEPKLLALWKDGKAREDAEALLSIAEKKERAERAERAKREEAEKRELEVMYQQAQLPQKPTPTPTKRGDATVRVTPKAPKVKEVPAMKKNILDEDVVDAVKKFLSFRKIDFTITSAESGYRFDYITFEPSMETEEKYNSLISKAVSKEQIIRSLKPILSVNAQGATVRTMRVVTLKDTRVYGGYQISIEKRSPQPMRKEHYLSMCTIASLEFVVEVDGKPQVFDFAKAPHLLIAGTTGSGKSVTQNMIIWFISQLNTPETLDLTLIAPKIDTSGGDFMQFNHLPHMTQPVITAVGKTMIQFLEEVKAKTSYVHDQMRIREDEFVSTGQEPKQWLVLAIDELRDVIGMTAAPKGAVLSEERMKENELKSQILEMLSIIAYKGRSSKIRLLFATQKPDAQLLDSMKANLSMMSLKVADKGSATVVGFTGQDGAMSLAGKGHGWLDIDGIRTQFQSSI